MYCLFVGFPFYMTSDIVTAWLFFFVLVISYVGPDDQDLAAEIKRILAEKKASFEGIFSRNKMLRRKINRRKLQKTDQICEKEDQISRDFQSFQDATNEHLEQKL